MPKYNCCVPGCTNSHRNKPSGFKFYCLPTDLELRKKYDVLLRNDNLKVTSKNTRICCEHWEGGQKLSRTHLPSIFPWTESKQPRRVIAKASQEAIDKHKRKRKNSTNNNDMSVNAMEIEDLELAATHLECSTQTDLPCFCNAEIEVKRLQDEKKQLEEETMFLKSELKRISVELNTVKTNFVRLQQQQTKFDIEKYKSNDTDIEFYTGLPNYKMLLFCFELVQASNNVSETEGEINQKTPKIGRPRALTPFQEYIMVLMRLRLGLFERDLAHGFGNIALGTVSNITRKWYKILHAELGPLIRMPERDIIKHYSPPAFKELFPKVVIVIDCTEIEMERPSALNTQSACYSSYKSRPTMKLLVGITPSGVLSYVSELFPGSTSDQEIIVKSNFLDILAPGDAMMADKGFKIKDELASVGATLEIPSFLQKSTQFTEEEINRNKAIASLRIHVERQMERIKNWHILDQRIPITMAAYASDIVVIISALTNFLPPLIPEV